MSSQEPLHIVLTNDFSEDLLDQIRAVSPRITLEHYRGQIPDSAWENADILYTTGQVPTPEQAPKLRWIQTNSAGMDRVASQPIVQSGQVVVTSVSGIHASTITEYCLAMILAFNYKVPTMLKHQGESLWPKDTFSIYHPQSLSEKTLGIVGYGSIGRDLARLAAGLGMKIVATKRNLKELVETDAYNEEGRGDVNAEIPERLYPPEALASMVSVCDYVVLAVPFTPETKNMVNAEILAAMKPSAYLINIARGGVVNEADLLDALKQGKLAGAALDVFEQEPLPADHPLWQEENVIISPHISGNTIVYHEKAAAVFIENLQRYLEGRTMLNKLDPSKGY
jgi:phosphoglycerate dehydrogenase-like enzyme